MNENSTGIPQELTLLKSDISAAGDILIPDEVTEDEALKHEDDDLMLAAPTPIVRYLQDIRSVPLLSREEEVRLAQQIEKGERQIVEKALSLPIALRFTLN
ncbi:MAG TPA: sigma-70 factor domain-containing protein, partial [Terriglobales bacterium]|nr:sigma-70 factor domain-containing protein [Terriglobales bacterium]